MNSLWSLLYILMSPILCGGLIPMIAMHYGVDPETSVLGFVGYTVVWFWIWADVLDEGRKLEI